MKMRSVPFYNNCTNMTSFTIVYVYTCTDHPVSSPLGLQGKIASKKVKEVSL